LWQLAAEGKTILPNGDELMLDPTDWIGMVKWIYNHIDGPPPERKEITGKDGGALRIQVVYDDYPNQDAPTAPGPG